MYFINSNNKHHKHDLLEEIPIPKRVRCKEWTIPSFSTQLCREVGIKNRKEAMGWEKWREEERDQYHILGQ